MPYLIEVPEPPADGTPCVRGTVEGVKAVVRCAARGLERARDYGHFSYAYDLTAALAPFQEPKE